jgi:hypothetical protein
MYYATFGYNRREFQRDYSSSLIFKNNKAL